MMAGGVFFVVILTVSLSGGRTEQPGNFIENLVEALTELKQELSQESKEARMTGYENNQNGVLDMENWISISETDDLLMNKRGTCDAASGVGPHDMTCLRYWWSQIGCKSAGTHSPDNKPDLAWWHARTVAEVKTDMNLFKAWADGGMSGYPEKCYGPGSCEVASGVGPHDMDCLRQWWSEVGCTPRGTHSPENKPDISWWHSRTAAEVKADMNLFSQWADEDRSGYVEKCHGPAATVSQDEVQIVLLPEITDAELAAAEAAYIQKMQEVSAIAGDAELNETLAELEKPDPVSPLPDWPVNNQIPVHVTGQEAVVFNGNDRKRGIIGSIIQLFTSSLSLASNIQLLVNAVSEGCESEPTICTDRVAIQSLLDDIKAQEELLKTKNMDIQLDYVTLRKVMRDNQYLLEYTRQTMESVGKLDKTMQDIQKELDLTEAEVQALVNQPNATAEKIMNRLFGPLDRTTKTIEAVVAKAEKETWDTLKQKVARKIGMMVVKKVIGTWALNAFKRTADVLKYKPEFQTTDEFRRMSKSFAAFQDTKPTTIQKKLTKLKVGFEDVKSLLKNGLIKDSFKDMISQPGKYLKLAKDNILAPRNAIKGIKDAFNKKVTKVLDSVKEKYGLIKEKKYVEFFKDVAGFKKWSSLDSWGRIKKMGGVLASAFGAVFTTTTSIISIITENAKWDEIAAQLAAAKAQYQTILNGTQYNVGQVDSRYQQLQQSWGTTIGSFKDVAENFKGMLNNMTEIEELIKNSELDFQVDTNGPIFKPNYFDGMTKDNVRVKQIATITAVVPIKDGFYKVSEMYRGMHLYAKDVNKYSTEGKTTKEIKVFVSGVMRFFELQEVKLYGTTITEKDILCTISISSKPTAEKYDDYDLAPFRTAQCDVSDADWLKMKTAAIRTKFERDLKSLLTLPVQAQRSISALKDMSINHFNNQNDADFKALGQALTEKEILCQVAKLTDSTLYDFYQMALYRREKCTDITDADFQASKQAADGLRDKFSAVESMLLTCSLYSYCPCPFDIVTENEFKLLAPIADTTLTQYCVSAQVTCAVRCVSLP